VKNSSRAKQLLSGIGLLLVVAFSRADFTIEDSFEGCDYEKVYKLTNGQFLVCESYGYAYSYRPEVYTLDGGRVLVDGDEYRGRVVNGRVIETQIDGDWEGCDFDVHKLMNGMRLVCSTFFYEYAFMPSVEIFMIDGLPNKVVINGDEKSGVVVVDR
jgi:hypothetical protein